MVELVKSVTRGGWIVKEVVLDLGEDSEKVIVKHAVDGTVLRGEVVGFAGCCGFGCDSEG